MPCDRCEELEERVKWLEGELGLQHSARESSVVGETFGLTPMETWFVLAIYKARGRPVDRNWLLDSRPYSKAFRSEYPSINMLRVYITKVRKGVGKDAIGTQWGVGYYMTPEGIAKIDAALKEKAHGDQG